MKKGQMPETRRKVGADVMRRAEKRINGRMKLRDQEAVERVQRQAADYAYHMPFVTKPFVNAGMVPGGNVSSIIHLFRPNLWVQDYAHYSGKLGKLDLFNAVERGEASAEYVIEKTSYIPAMIRSRKVTEDDFYRAVREATLIESAYQSRLAGDDMPEDVRRKIDTALMQRALKSGVGFRTMCRKLNVDPSDPLALIQVSQSIDLTGALQDIISEDPYFARRRENIADLARKPIDAEESIKAAANGDALILALLDRYLKRKDADPHIMRAIKTALEADAPVTRRKRGRPRKQADQSV